MKVAVVLGTRPEAIKLCPVILALKADPFTAQVWQNAAMCAMYALELKLMGEYVDEGLAIFPQDETLLMLRESMIDAVKKMESEQ